MYLLGDTETLQQQAQVPQPVSLQELCARKPTPSVSPSASCSELDVVGQDAVNLQGMLSTICSAATSHGLGLRARSHPGNRRRSSSVSVRLASIPDILEDDGSDLATGAGRASQLLQHLAMRRGNSGEGAVDMKQSTSGVVGVGASAAAMLHQYTSGPGGAGDGSCGNTSGEDIGQSTDDDEEDSSVSGSADAATESACGSQAAAGDSSVVSMKLARPQAPVAIDHLEEVLASAYEWQFDAFALNEASQGHPLSTLGYYLFHRQGLIDHFKLKPTNLARFLRRCAVTLIIDYYLSCVSLVATW